MDINKQGDDGFISVCKLSNISNLDTQTNCKFLSHNIQTILTDKNFHSWLPYLFAISVVKT